jgi:hypothetical protein
VHRQRRYVCVHVRVRPLQSGPCCLRARALTLVGRPALFCTNLCVCQILPCVYILWRGAVRTKFGIEVRPLLHVQATVVLMLECRCLLGIHARRLPRLRMLHALRHHAGRPRDQEERARLQDHAQVNDSCRLSICSRSYCVPRAMPLQQLLMQCSPRKSQEAPHRPSPQHIELRFSVTPCHRHVALCSGAEWCSSHPPPPCRGPLPCWGSLMTLRSMTRVLSVHANQGKT